jgi:hypothetical protein
MQNIDNSQYAGFQCLMGDCIHNQAHVCRKIEPSIENGECLSCETAYVAEDDYTMPFDEFIQSIQATRDIRVELHNAQGVPHVNFIDTEGKIMLQISFCKDGGIIQKEGSQPIGVKSGERLMLEQSDYREPKKKDSILVGVLKVRGGK